MVQLLEAIKQAEDRELFKEAMKEINQPVPESDIFNDLEEAVAFANRIGYPIIIRPAYTLGGTGGGIAHNEDEMYEITRRGLKLSPIHQIPSRTFCSRLERNRIRSNAR